MGRIRVSFLQFHFDFKAKIASLVQENSAAAAQLQGQAQAQAQTHEAVTPASHKPGQGHGHGHGQGQGKGQGQRGLDPGVAAGVDSISVGLETQIADLEAQLKIAKQQAQHANAARSIHFALNTVFWN